MKVMNANQVRAMLCRLGSCSTARRWADGRTLEQVVQQCDHAGWLMWLLMRCACAKRRGWPSRAKVQALVYQLAKVASKYMADAYAKDAEGAFDGINAAVYASEVATLAQHSGVFTSHKVLRLLRAMYRKEVL